MAHRGGDQDVDARDRLECERAHFQMRLAQSGLHRVDDLAREESRDDRCLRAPTALSDERLEVVAVECVADRAVADAVVARRIVYGMRLGELLLCCLYAGKVEVALLCGRDRPRDILRRLGGHRVERAPRCGDGGTVERARTLGEAPFDLADDCRDLRHIVNLSVEHGTCLMLHAFRCKDVEDTLTLLGDNADDAARTDVECKDKLCLPLAARRAKRRCALVLFRTAAALCRLPFRLLLYTLFGAAAPFCGLLRGGNFFVDILQIRHFCLP